ncbi:MAG TPA: biotin transporter BioY [Candidatus Dormibacteraeota bacterium]|nr:biotin transporter BioY [Candidatus Dormibacteraeota bacterium]
MLQAVSARRSVAPVLSDLIPGERVRDLMVVIGFAATVGIFAQLAIRLPFTPVPITGQTFAVLLGGMAVGTRRALAGMLLYVAAGLVGVPWFAQGAGGLAALATPSFGYIVGFVFAATGLGLLARMKFDRKPLLVLAAMVAGNLVIYCFGATWLAVDLHLNAATAISLGVTPFLLGDAVKAVVAMGLLPTTWRLVGGHGPDQRSQ